MANIKRNRAIINQVSSIYSDLNEIEKQIEFLEILHFQMIKTN